VINKRTDTTVFGTSGKAVIERRGENTELINNVHHQNSSKIKPNSP
jgi:hypothetical protein